MHNFISVIEGNYKMYTGDQDNGNVFTDLGCYFARVNI